MDIFAAFSPFSRYSFLDLVNSRRLPDESCLFFAQLDQSRKTDGTGRDSFKRYLGQHARKSACSKSTVANAETMLRAKVENSENIKFC